MTSKKFIFALAMLQAVVQGQGEFFLDGQEHDDSRALDNQEDSELGLSLRNLRRRRKKKADDIHKTRYFASDDYLDKCADEKLDLLW